jgi:hypothetical protein
MRLAELKHMERRAALLHTLEELSDPEYQRLNWVEKRSGNPWDSFDEVIHFLFDDSNLAEDASKEVGFILLDEAEAMAVSKVTSALDLLLNVRGTRLTDAQYIASPEWKGIVECAHHAAAIVRGNGAGPCYFPADNNSLQRP